MAGTTDTTEALAEIRLLRKKYSLSQTQLARLAGVSQSLIAKIEAGRIDPTYSKAQKILQALERLHEEKELKAEEIMNPKVISLSPADSIKEAVQTMRKFEISQMPVLEGDTVVGIVSEGILLNALISNKKLKTVSEIMEDAPPIISKDASAKVVSSLLKHFPVVLVAGKGKLKGVITKADVLSKMVK